MNAAVSRQPFGVLASGEAIEQVTLRLPSGVSCTLISYGATLTHLHAPDRTGTLADVVLGFDDLASYAESRAYFGAIAGRFANRIARGRFALNGVTHELPLNDPPNHLHGGLRGFDRYAWKVDVPDTSRPSVQFRMRSPSGDQGYPGSLEVAVTYTLCEPATLRIEFEARTDAPTVVNLTNHAYFNLRGSGTILDHEVTLHAPHYTPSDANLVPTGEIAPVAGTPLDFRRRKRVGRDIGLLTNKPQGYDHNFVLESSGQALGAAANVREPSSGRTLDVWTTEPGIQFYTGNFLNASILGKAGRIYDQYTGFCLETQHFPDSPNQPSFPSTVLVPGSVFRSQTEFRFGVEA